MKGVVIALIKIKVPGVSTFVAPMTGTVDGNPSWFGNEDVMPG